MPVIVDPAVVAGYARFPSSIERDWLGRVTHLSAADVQLVRRRVDPTTQLGFAVQLAALRGIGTFVADVTEVPLPFVEAVADQLLIDDPMPLLAGYAQAPVRWRHAGEIRERYGYRGFAGRPRWLFTKWLYRQSWDDELTATMLFRAAHHQLLVRRILLPGHSVLARLIATVRERTAVRVHARLIDATPMEVRARLEKLLLVVQGGRYSELDLLRRPPFTPTIGGLVKALERLTAIRALGAGELDVSRVPARRVAALARYADQAWATQLADLAPARRVATLVAYLHLLTATARDDVLDIFDVVFGDLQRAATHRGQKRRVGELRDYDRAVAALHARMRSVLDALGDGLALTRVLEELRVERDAIEEHMAQVETLMRPPGDPFHERLIASYPQIRRFLSLFIDAFDLASIPAAAPVLAAYHALERWLVERPRTTALPAAQLPLEVITPSWRAHVLTPDGTITRPGYTCCVLDALRQRLRRRDVFLPGSTRWGDPRAELLPTPTWQARRADLCDELGLQPQPHAVVEDLAAVLDAAWKGTAAALRAIPDLRIEHRHGRDEIVQTPLDAEPESASLRELRAKVTALLPEVEIADLPLEVHAWTGFLDEYTHISDTSGEPDPTLPETLSALLVSEACNVGLTPVADEDYPPLRRDRLNWVSHNYLRSGTHAGANTRLVDYHTPLALAQAWGGGEMASADGMRFVIPVATIHAGYNPRYFGRQRGSTLYSWMADTHTVFAQTLIPGTQRDSLHALDGLLANQTLIQPAMVSTDTAGASEIVFALAWVLGYRWAPRLADLPDQRLWRIDPRAHYGPLNDVARHHVNTRLIAENWDEICRLAASLRERTVTPSAIMRTLQRGPNPSSLARGLTELGRVIKTLHVLEYCRIPTYRRTIHRMLNRGESRNSLARDMFHGQRGQLRKHYQVGQENQLDTLGLMINVVVLWETVYMQAALDHLTDQGYPIDPTDVARLSPLAHPTINLQGRYRATSSPPKVGLRPLRTSG